MSERPCDCKVGRNVATYGLVRFDRTLQRRHEGGASLRELARYHDVRLLEAALADTETTVVGDAGAVYDKLTDGTDAGRRAEAEARLSNAGVDVEALRADFVSHQTVRAHLRTCLSRDTDRSSEMDVDRARSTTEWARARSEAVVARTLERLRDAGGIATGDLDVTGTIRVTCTDCGRTYRTDELIDRGGCDCGR